MVTVTVALPDAPLSVALMVVEPAATAGSQAGGADGCDGCIGGLQVAVEVMSAVDPVAVGRGRGELLGRSHGERRGWGVTAMEVMPVTASVALPVMPLNEAVMVVEPAETAVARPALLMVATAVVEELQVAVAVMSCVEPSL